MFPLHNPDYRELPPEIEDKFDGKICVLFRPRLPVDAGDGCVECANCGQPKFIHKEKRNA